MSLPDPDDTMTLEFFSATDTGRARNNNEDSVAVDEPSCLIVLADGMGGYNAGEVASGMATTFIRTELARWLSQAGQHREQEGGADEREQVSHHRTSVARSRTFTELTCRTTTLKISSCL